MYFNYMLANFINTANLNSLKLQEYQYKSSDTALSNNREFGVGFCGENYNGQKVMKLHQRIWNQPEFLGKITVCAHTIPRVQVSPIVCPPVFHFVHLIFYFVHLSTFNLCYLCGNF